MVPQHSQQLEAIAFMVSVENQRSDLLAWYSVKAEGEAEAELAYLNRIGVIDAVLTDDVDALVFGAVNVIRK